MTKSDRQSRAFRIVIAITELAPVQPMWREALQQLDDSPAELLALFLAEDHWHRAASLSFTREISRLGGMDADFTPQRATDVHKNAISRKQRQLQALADEADCELEFEVLSESEQEKVAALVTETRTLVIAPALLADRPLFEKLKQLDCHVVLISD